MATIYMVMVGIAIYWVLFGRTKKTHKISCASHGVTARTMAAALIATSSIVALPVGAFVAEAATDQIDVTVTPIAGVQPRYEYIDGDQLGYFFFRGSRPIATSGGGLFGYHVYSENGSLRAQLVKTDGVSASDPVEVLWSSEQLPSPEVAWPDHMIPDGNGNLYLVDEYYEVSDDVYTTKVDRFDAASGKVEPFYSVPWTGRYFDPMYSAAPNGDFVLARQTVGCYVAMEQSVPTELSVTRVSPGGAESSVTVEVGDTNSVTVGQDGFIYAAASSCTSTAPSTEVLRLDPNGPTKVWEHNIAADYVTLKQGQGAVYAAWSGGSSLFNEDESIGLFDITNNRSVRSFTIGEAGAPWTDDWLVAGTPGSEIVFNSSLQLIEVDGSTIEPSYSDINEAVPALDAQLGRARFAVRSDGKVVLGGVATPTGTGSGIYSLTDQGSGATMPLDIESEDPGYPIAFGFSPDGRTVRVTPGTVDRLDGGRQGPWTRLYGSDACGAVSDGEDARTADLCIADARVSPNGIIDFVGFTPSYPDVTYYLGRIVDGVVRVSVPELEAETNSAGFKVAPDGAVSQVITNGATSGVYDRASSTFVLTDSSGQTTRSSVDSGYVVSYTVGEQGTIYAIVSDSAFGETVGAARLLVLRGESVVESPIDPALIGADRPNARMVFGDDGQLYLNGAAGLYRLDGAVPVEIAKPAAPKWVDDPSKAGDAHYAIPANTAQIVWTENADRSVTARIVVPNTFFPDGTQSVTFAKKTDVGPTTVAVPSAPKVTDDPAVKGDAKYVLPTDTARFKWVANSDGSVTVTLVRPNDRFPDGKRSHVYPAPVDKYVPVVTPRDGYRAVTPTRLVDTRSSDGLVAAQGIRPAKSVLRIDADKLGIYRKGDKAEALHLAITITDPEANGYVTAYPCGVSRSSSTVNAYRAGQSIVNAATIPLNDDGDICFYNLMKTHLVIDVMGYFTSSSTEAPSSFKPLDPTRLVDTRSNDGLVSLNGKRSAGSVIEIDAAKLGLFGSSDDVTALHLTFTAARPEKNGYFAAYPCGKRPLSSVLNISHTSQVISNTATIPVSATGKVCIYTSMATHVVVDITGYFAASSASADATSYRPVWPRRVTDTRFPTGLVDNTGIRFPKSVLRIDADKLPIYGSGDKPVALDLTVTLAGSHSAGYVTVYPCGKRPLASAVNLDIGNRAIANSIIVPVNAKGDVCFYTSMPTHLVVDVTGYFVE